MNFDRLKQINELNASKATENKRHTELQTGFVETQKTILEAFKSLVDYLDNKVTKTQVVNNLKSINTPDALRVIPEIQSLHETLKTHENVDLTEVTKVMQAVLEEAKKIPKELPKEKEEQFVDYTKQFSALSDAVKAVEKVVKEQKLIAEAPIVNVPETNVHVEPPDLKPLQTSMKAVVTAVQKIVIPEYKTDNKEVEKLLKASNKLLKGILEKPVSSGGGGGGRVSPYSDSAGMPSFVTLTVDGKIPVEAGATSTYEARNDTTTDTNLVYLGKALPGSLTSDAAWQIKRYNKSAGHMSFADDATTFTKIWDNRTSYGY